MYGLLLGAVFASWYLFNPLIVMIIGGFNDFSIKKANEQDEKNFIKSGSDLEQSLHAIKIVIKNLAWNPLLLIYPTYFIKIYYIMKIKKYLKNIILL